MSDATNKFLHMASPPIEETHHSIPSEDVAEGQHLAQFIPMHHHQNMLMDESRMSATLQHAGAG
jgi:hypothetical protein